MSDNPTIRRRRVLQLLAGGAAGLGAVPFALGDALAPPGLLTVGDARLSLRIDGSLRSQVLSHRARGTVSLTALEPAESLTLAGGHRVDLFRVTGHDASPVDGIHGRGTRHRVTGLALDGIEKTLTVTFYDRYPGTAALSARYHNGTPAALAIAGWTVAAHVQRGAHGSEQSGFWSFSGSSHEDRRDWVQRVGTGFHQPNYMGMNASDYGGGTPVVDVWRRDGGIAIGHLATHPQLVSLPITAVPAGVRTAVEAERAFVLAPGEAFDTVDCFLHVHDGDYFESLDTYRQLMADAGLHAQHAPEAAYGPIWCAWGYERNFTTAEIEGTLGKARSLGFEWAVLDDGWQTSEGDWHVDRSKFPRGEADMKSFADDVKAAGMKPRLWYSPLSVSPGADLLHDHVDMLLLDKNGAVQNVSWWNAFYLCPAYAPTVEYTERLVEKMLGEWGYAGLKLDGQHLNGVAPCYNPAHHHARPEESVEKLQDFWQAIYQTATRINPDAVVELCPCGTSFAFHNIAAMNQTPASDPESSRQIRQKGKTLKALMGSAGSFAGDHVELSDHGDDFASTVGIGAVVSTKFTWPADTPHPTAPQPKGGYLLTPEKEVLWRKWVSIYRDKMLPKGRYLGTLYDIGFDKPEAHAIERNGHLYYAFYADHWDGPLELRGLGAGPYSVTDYVTGASLGTVSAAAHRLHAAFSRSLLLEVVPLTNGAA